MEARASALAALEAILRDRTSLDEALSAARGETGDARDRAFARTLVMTALRRLGQIDAALKPFIAKPLPGKSGPARNILRLGTAELLFLGVAPHAAIDSANRLAARDRDARHFKALINAVLRRVAGEGPSIVATQDAPRLNTPDWLWTRWTAAYGAATARAIAKAHLDEPPLDFSVKADPKHWAEALGARILPTGTLRRAGGGRIDDLPGYRDGTWWVQDAAAALPARLLDVKPGETVVDLCAAPGGKTAQLMAAGATVTALDIAPTRLKRLEDNLARLNLTARTLCADARVWRPETPADAVLLDAPCSATGTIRRHPDLPWIKNADNIAETMPMQRALLDAAVAMVRPGGRIVYAVCALEPEEGEGQIESLLARSALVRRAPISPAELPGLAEALTPAGDVRLLPSLWPGDGGLDGFFIARLIRA